jgi:hypothetical protein
MSGYTPLKSGYNKPTIITAQQYGTKVSVELDHSDTDLDELIDAFKTLIVGLGYSESAWKENICERAADYMDEDNFKDEIMVSDGLINLSKKDAEILFESINKNSEPNEILKEAAKKYSDDARKKHIHIDDFKIEESEFDDYGKRINKK